MEYSFADFRHENLQKVGKLQETCQPARCNVQLKIVMTECMCDYENS